MDVIKIGKYISQKRKELNLTQKDLADSLYISDRAVSKWECGKSLPDSSIMLDLCKLLNISINELLLGEDLKMENQNNQLEQTVLELIKEKEQTDKKLLQIEVVIGLTGTIFNVALIILGALGYAYLNLPLWAMILMISFGVVLFIISITIALIIEQKAGYYECKNCGHRYVPTFLQVLLAPHINRSRYMKCPNCHKRTYNKKVISKNK